jgi:hypothetical protein
MAILARNTTFIDGNTLSASDLHTELDHLYSGLYPSQLEDASTDLTAHQTMTDPTGAALPANMQEEIQQLRYQVDAIIGGAQWYSTVPNDLTELNNNSQGRDTRLGYVQRSKFEYKNTSEIIIYPGVYQVGSTGDIARITSITTFALGDSQAKGGCQKHYFYIDGSKLTGSTTDYITSSDIIASTTAPTWSNSLMGWYHSSDRCIFGIAADTTNGHVPEFFHDGNLIMLADQFEELADTDIDSTYTDLTFLTMPSFARMADVSFILKDGATGAHSASWYWRTDGQTGTTGHKIGNINTVNEINSVSMRIISSSTQKIEVMESCDGADDTISARMNAWYLPIGM